MNDRFSRRAILGFVFILNGCGGSDPVEVDVLAAHANYTMLQGTWEMSGIWNDGQPGNFSVRYEALENAIFPYTQASAVRRKLTSSWGHPFGATQYFDADTRLQIGLYFADDCLVLQPSELPTSAKVGDSGLLFDSFSFSIGCTPDGGVDLWEISRYFWAVEEIDGVPYFCLGLARDDESGEEIANQRECYEVNESNELGSRAAFLYRYKTVDGPMPGTRDIVAKGGRTGP
jgi:hypothetical protein